MKFLMNIGEWIYSGFKFEARTLTPDFQNPTIGPRVVACGGRQGCIGVYRIM